jgi:hypothetical protein
MSEGEETFATEALRAQPLFLWFPRGHPHCSVEFTQANSAAAGIQQNTL